MLILHRFQTSYFGLNKGQVSLASRDMWLNLKINNPNLTVKCSTFTFNRICFVAKQKFVLKPTLTCPLLRRKDICIGFYVLQRLFNFWHILNESVSMQ